MPDLCCQYKTWFPVLCLLLSPLLPAENRTSYHFKPISTAVTLPTNEVRNLYQDSEGYIWISTYNGLLRYDGYDVITYKPDRTNPNRSIGSFVNTVAEDRERNLWIGTHNGLYVLEKPTNKIEKIVCPILRISSVETIVCASSGDIWVGTNKGLFHRKAGSRQFDNVRELDIKSLMEDRQGEIWIGTWSQGLLRYSPKEERFYTYNKINPGNSAHVIFQDDGDNIWVGTWRYGLIKLINPYDPEQFSFRSYRHAEGNKYSLLDDIVYTIAQDKNSKKLWIGSRSGVSILEEEAGGGRFSNFIPGDRQHDLPFNEVNALLCSNDGVMWLGLLGGGVCTVNTEQLPFGYDPLESLHRFCPTSSVRSLFQEENGTLWMGVMGFGLVQYERKSRVITPYKEHPILKKMGYTSTVNDILHRKQTGELCFATWDDGVWFYHPKKGEATALNAQTVPQLNDVCIYSLLEDSKGNLWIGSRSGLSILMPNGQLHPLHELLPKGSKPLPPVSIFDLAEESGGAIWIATGNRGVWRVESSGESFHIDFYTPTTGTMNICVDHYNRVWLGTNGNGLMLYDRKKDRFVPILTDYFANGDVVFSILEDEKHTLWLTTNSEMLHLDMPPDGGEPTVQTYSVEDGLQDYIFNRNACCRGANNELLFGGFRGVNSFFPDKIEPYQVASPVVITDIKIYNVSLRELPSEQQQRIAGNHAIDCIEKIELSHKENNFNIEFALLNYKNPALNHYLYKLEGYDREWISVGADRRFAYYNNLPAGSYTFYVRAADQNGNWSPEVRQLEITIQRAPWLSGWAYSLYLLLSLLLAGYSYRMIRNRLRMKRAIELGQVERLKIEEINHAKLQFFTNITHELLTPLSIISASVDELKQEQRADPKRCDSITENTNRLVRLIQQILEFRKIEHGKIVLRVSQGNITQFIHKSILAFAPLVKKKRLSICFEREEEYLGYFDADKLDKISYNLLSNAAKYTPEGGVITIKQGYKQAEGIFTCSINNPGEVIPQERQKHLFERFYEGEYRKFHTIGTGIGLSLTKELLTLHHGTISLRSEKGEGNTFLITLPIERRAYTVEEIDEELESKFNQQLPPHEEEREEHRHEPTAIPGQATLLVVEDNDELLGAMIRLLQGKYNLITAQNGIEALQLLEQQEIQLVISDVMMPGMDGIELCRRAKTTFETCHIPFILLTAKTGDEDRVTGYESGADGYICKPLRLSVLFAKIDNLLKRQRRMGIDFRKQLVFEAKELNYTSMDEQFIQKAVACVNEHLDDSGFEHAQFIAEMGMSRTTLADKLKLLTGLTPSTFISNVRLQAACRLIDEHPKIRVTDLAYAVGFNDPKYFSSCFKKKFSLSPTEYMTQYGREEEE